VLLLTTVLSVRRWTTMAELAEAVRAAVPTKKTGLADTDKSFRAGGKEEGAKLFASDETHLGAAGHELMATTLLEAIEKAGQVAAPRTGLDRLSLDPQQWQRGDCCAGGPRAIGRAVGVVTGRTAQGGFEPCIADNLRMKSNTI
jgi:hypothetical protein